MHDEVSCPRTGEGSTLWPVASTDPVNLCTILYLTKTPHRPRASQSPRPAASLRGPPCGPAVQETPLQNILHDSFVHRSTFFDDFTSLTFFQEHHETVMCIRTLFFYFVEHSDSLEVVYMGCVSEGGGSVGGMLTALLYHSLSLGAPPSAAPERSHPRWIILFCWSLSICSLPPPPACRGPHNSFCQVDFQ